MEGVLERFEWYRRLFDFSGDIPPPESAGYGPEEDPDQNLVPQVRCRCPCEHILRLFLLNHFCLILYVTLRGLYISSFIFQFVHRTLPARRVSCITFVLSGLERKGTPCALLPPWMACVVLYLPEVRSVMYLCQTCHGCPCSWSQRLRSPWSQNAWPRRMTPCHGDRRLLLRRLCRSCWCMILTKRR